MGMLSLPHVKIIGRVFLQLVGVFLPIPLGEFCLQLTSVCDPQKDHLFVLIRNNSVKINSAYLGFGSIHFGTVQKVISVIYNLEVYVPS